MGFESKDTAETPVDKEEGIESKINKQKEAITKKTDVLKDRDLAKNLKQLEKPDPLKDAQEVLGKTLGMEVFNKLEGDADESEGGERERLNQVHLLEFATALDSSKIIGEIPKPGSAEMPQIDQDFFERAGKGAVPASEMVSTKFA